MVESTSLSEDHRSCRAGGGLTPADARAVQPPAPLAGTQRRRSGVSTPCGQLRSGFYRSLRNRRPGCPGDCSQRWL